MNRLHLIAPALAAAAACGPGFASLKAESVATLAVGADPICGWPGIAVPLIVTATTKDGKQLRSATATDTEGRLDPTLFTYRSNLGTVDRRGILKLPTNTLELLQPLEVEIELAKPDPKTAVAPATATLAVRFDCETVVDLRGAPGTAGSESYPYYESSRNRAAPSGYAGSNGGNGGAGGSGPNVEIAIGWLPAGGDRLALARVTDGRTAWFYLLDPRGPGLVVDVSGGAGGNGGSGQWGNTSGNFTDPGTNGGAGGAGGNGGTGGAATVLAEDAAASALVKINASGGPAGRGGPGGRGGSGTNMQGSPLPSGANGPPGQDGQPGAPGAPPALQIVASPTTALVAAAGGAPASIERAAPPPAASTAPPTPESPAPAAGAPAVYRGELVLVLEVEKPAREPAVTRTMTAAARVIPDGRKTQLQMENGCAFELPRRKGTLRGATCANGEITLRALRGRYEVSAAAVAYDLRGTFEVPAAGRGDKPVRGTVRIRFRGTP